MPFKYYDPAKVSSPKDFIESVKVIYDEGEDDVSVAIINWEGKKSLGIRWNVARRELDNAEKASGKQISVGMPSSHGYPVWFILPNELFDEKSDLCKTIKQFKRELGNSG